MKKQKILILSLVISILGTNNLFVYAGVQKQNPAKTTSKKLKGSVADYQLEYVNNEWWGNFNDTILSDYINKASKANYDLKIATLRVHETQALVQQMFGKEFPVVSIGSDFLRQKTSDNIAMGDFSIPTYTQNTYLFPLNANYELDLWRKNRDMTIREEKTLEAVKYDEKSAFISLTSAVAATYFNVIKTDKLMTLQKEKISLRKEILDLTKEKNSNGLCSTAEVILADKALTEAESALNDLEKKQGLFLNQLAVLTGSSVDDALKMERTSIDKIEIINNLPLNIKAEVIQKRPDILKAEAELQKAKIDVNLARKDFLPDISISGQFGFNANSLSKVFKWDSYVASIGAGMVEHIFTGGQRLAKLKAKKYHYEALLQNYQKTILVSCQELNDSLISLKTDSQKNKDNISRINFEKHNLDLINYKYDQGIISHLDTLEYKEKLASLEKEQIESKADCLIDSLSLYKASGGKNLADKI